MNLNYEQVPNIISSKDLDYLSDMFSWNSGAYKKAKNCLQQVQDQEIKGMIEQASNVFLDNVNTILEILNGGNQNE